MTLPHAERPVYNCVDAGHMPRVSVIVLAYGDEPWLRDCVTSALASRDVGVDVVVVDNGAPGHVIESLSGMPGVQIVTPGFNTGFAGGCNLGATVAMGDVLVFLNDDAVVRENALRQLCDALDDTTIGAACASVRCAENDQVINTAGNPLHFTGLSWAGGHGQLASEHGSPRDVAVAAGTCMAMKRVTWKRLGGFRKEYFAYHEDVELSWRSWQHGLRCVYVPNAVAVHRYEFRRNPRKLGLIERNRLQFIVTSYERRSLAVLAPALLLVELAMFTLAVREGWWRQKLDGYRWLLEHRTSLKQRRREVADSRTHGDGELFHLMCARVDTGTLTRTPSVRLFELVLRGYWALVRGMLVGARQIKREQRPPAGSRGSA